MRWGSLGKEGASARGGWKQAGTVANCNWTSSGMLIWESDSGVRCDLGRTTNGLGSVPRSGIEHQRLLRTKPSGRMQCIRNARQAVPARFSTNYERFFPQYKDDFQKTLLACKSFCSLLAWMRRSKKSGDPWRDVSALWRSRLAGQATARKVL